MTDNYVQITGNATGAPEMRFTPSAARVASFSVAVNRRWKNAQGEWDEQVSFFDVVAWNDLAENVTDTVQKGMRVTVTGRLEQRTWQTDDGSNRSKVEIVATDVAPSLRWATAEVTRNERNNDGFSGQSKPAAAPPAYNENEEPFRVDAGEWMPGHHGTYPERKLQ